MSEVINLDAHRPHLQGPARCWECKHEWQAVVLADGHVSLECPECHMFKGAFMGLYAPKESIDIWTFNCGNDRFLIMPDGILCEFCGVTHDRDCGR